MIASHLQSYSPLNLTQMHTQLEGVLGDLSGKWVSLPSHGLQGLPTPLLVRASTYSDATHKPQRNTGNTCNVAKAVFVAVSSQGSGEGEQGQIKGGVI